jgi:hypothetical protein
MSQECTTFFQIMVMWVTAFISFGLQLLCSMWKKRSNLITWRQSRAMSRLSAWRRWLARNQQCLCYLVWRWDTGYCHVPSSDGPGVCLQPNKSQASRWTVTYTHSFFILCIEFHAAGMQTKFCWSFQHHITGEQAWKIKREVTTTLKVVHLFPSVIVIFQHNHRAHWCIYPNLARTYKCRRGRNLISCIRDHSRITISTSSLTCNTPLDITKVRDMPAVWPSRLCVLLGELAQHL